MPYLGYKPRDTNQNDAFIKKMRYHRGIMESKKYFRVVDGQQVEELRPPYLIAHTLFELAQNNAFTQDLYDETLDILSGRYPEILRWSGLAGGVVGAADELSEVEPDYEKIANALMKYDLEQFGASWKPRV